MSDLIAVRGPVGVNILMLGGNNYFCDENRIFYIPSSHLVAAQAHNFHAVDPIDLQNAHNVSELSARAVEQKVIYPDTATNMQVDNNANVALQKDAEQFTGEAKIEADTLAANPKGDHVIDPNDDGKLKGKKGK